MAETKPLFDTRPPMDGAREVADHAKKLYGRVAGAEVLRRQAADLQPPGEMTERRVHYVKMKALLTAAAELLDKDPDDPKPPEPGKIILQ